MTVLLTDQEVANLHKVVNELSALAEAATKDYPLSRNLFAKTIKTLRDKIRGWERVNVDIAVFLDQTEWCEKHGNYLKSSCGCPACFQIDPEMEAEIDAQTQAWDDETDVVMQEAKDPDLMGRDYREDLR